MAQNWPGMLPVSGTACHPAPNPPGDPRSDRVPPEGEGETIRVRAQASVDGPGERWARGGGGRKSVCSGRARSELGWMTGQGARPLGERRVLGQAARLGLRERSQRELGSNGCLRVHQGTRRVGDSGRCSGICPRRSGASGLWTGVHGTRGVEGGESWGCGPIEGVSTREPDRNTRWRGAKLKPRGRPRGRRGRVRRAPPSPLPFRPYLSHDPSGRSSPSGSHSRLSPQEPPRPGAQLSFVPPRPKSPPSRSLPCPERPLPPASWGRSSPAASLTGGRIEKPASRLFPAGKMDRRRAVGRVCPSTVPGGCCE